MSISPVRDEEEGQDELSGLEPDGSEQAEPASDDEPQDAGAQSDGDPELAASASSERGAEDRSPRIGPGNQLDEEGLLRETFALLFASPDPLDTSRLSELLQRPERKRLKAALEALTERLARSGLPMVLREVGGGWRLFTDPEQDPTIQRLMRARKVERLSAAALETLSIVAYRQPVTKAEIEAIRGVQAGPMLRNLVDRGLVRVTGRAEQPGSPLQYGTTKEFLDRFGLASLSQLPRDAELVRE